MFDIVNDALGFATCGGGIAAITTSFISSKVAVSDKASTIFDRLELLSHVPCKADKVNWM